METRIEPMRPDDWDEVRRIYLQGIATGVATFETEVPDYETWDRAHVPQCRLVARRGDRLLAWAAMLRVSPRAVYAGVAEISIYVAEEARGQGVGRSLLDALVAESEREGFWTLQAGLFAENEVSRRLHEACGFRVVGTREKLGCLRGRWRDVLLLERRSRRTGVPDA
jgi:phosphinothricin acetyltransferase